MSTFTMAPELEARAEKRIKAHYPALRDVSILYVWRDKATRSHGSLVLGSTTRLSGRAAMLFAAAVAGEGNPYDAELNPDEDLTRYVIELASDVWLLLEEAQRDALLDHYLTRCRVDDEGRLALRAPTAEFPVIVERHGLWRDEITELGRALAKSGQLSLLAEEVEAT